jgi:hypothetical protein
MAKAKAKITKVAYGKRRAPGRSAAVTRKQAGSKGKSGHAKLLWKARPARSSDVEVIAVVKWGRKIGYVLTGRADYAKLLGTLKNTTVSALPPLAPIPLDTPPIKVKKPKPRPKPKG